MAVDFGFSVTCVIKGKERYVFLYADGCERDLFQITKRFSEDPDLSFNWFDMCRVNKKVRMAMLERLRR